MEALKKAITATEEEDFVRKNTEGLREAARSFIEKNEALLRSLEQAFQKTIENLPQIGLTLANCFSNIDREAILKSATDSIQNIASVMRQGLDDAGKENIQHEDNNNADQ